MLIRVKYLDSRYDMVRPEILDHLLDEGNILEFKRQDGWVTPGSCKLRKISRNEYLGSGRRWSDIEKRKISA